MKKYLFVALTLGWLNVSASIVTIDFEGVVADTDKLVSATPYLEDGMMVDSATDNGIFGKDAALTNTNGSAVFGWCNITIQLCEPNDLITVSNVGGWIFDLLSLDGSNAFNGQTPGDLTVTGFYEGGGSISTVLNLQLDTWQHFTFDSSWAGLDYVTIAATGGPSNWDPGIDNIVVNAVPIPAAVWLFGSGLGLLGWFRKRA